MSSDNDMKEFADYQADNDVKEFAPSIRSSWFACCLSAALGVNVENTKTKTKNKKQKQKTKNKYKQKTNTNTNAKKYKYNYTHPVNDSTLRIPKPFNMQTHRWKKKWN